MFLSFTAAIGAHSISEEVAGVSPLWFPWGKYLCLFAFVIIVVHVILSDNILRSYCLNDKNLTVGSYDLGLVRLDMRVGFK